MDWRPTDALRASLDLRPVAWPLYPLIGASLTVGLGGLLGLRHRTDAEPATPASR